MTIQPRWWADEVHVLNHWTQTNDAETFSNFLLTPLRKAFNGKVITIDGNSGFAEATDRKISNLSRIFWFIAFLFESLLVLPPLIGIVSYVMSPKIDKIQHVVDQSWQPISSFHKGFDTFLSQYGTPQYSSKDFESFLQHQTFDTLCSNIANMRASALTQVVAAGATGMIAPLIKAIVEASTMPFYATSRLIQLNPSVVEKGIQVVSQRGFHAAFDYILTIYCSVPDDEYGTLHKFLQDSLRVLIQQHQEELNSQDSIDKNVLQKACDADRADIVLELIVQGAKIDPNAQITIGSCKYPSLLFLAIRNGHLVAVEKLLAKGARVSVAYTEDTCIEYDGFMECCVGTTALHFAAGHFGGILDKDDPSTKIINTLLKVSTSEDVNRQDSQGQTPLHLAARHRDSAVTRILLTDERVNPNLTDQNGLTPLMVASSDLCLGFSVTRLLAQNSRVDKEAKDKNGRTALHYAYHFAASYKGCSVENYKLCSLDGKVASTADNFGHEPKHYLEHLEDWCPKTA